jgi:hypothetical protein
MRHDQDVGIIYTATSRKQDIEEYDRKGVRQSVNSARAEMVLLREHMKKIHTALAAEIVPGITLTYKDITIRNYAENIAISSAPAESPFPFIDLFDIRNIPEILCAAKNVIAEDKLRPYEPK